jgi:hypothetical protein
MNLEEILKSKNRKVAFDVYWTYMPTIKKRMTRSELIDARAKGQTSYLKYQSLMPIILRDLNPGKVLWKAAQEWTTKESQADAEAAMAWEYAMKTRRSRKEEIKAANFFRMQNEREVADIKKLDNLVKGGLAEIKSAEMKTPKGNLRKLLMILKGSLDSEDMPGAFDVLWAIEATKVFQDAEKDKKDDKKKGAPVSLEALLMEEYASELKKVRKAREKTPMAEYQLTEMHDRLPPLSVYDRSFKLDEWQRRVMAFIDENKSVVVCAPTSSGKTVISTYVARKVMELAKAGDLDSSVLFVVPSEPLVWQVAAVFAGIVEGEQVAICTNFLSYRPPGRSTIVVGTPDALESALSKVRGLVGSELNARGVDYAQLAGGFNFRYAVYDEVHSLDGKEGAALERLMRLVRCPFLALSATIGNGPALEAFLTTVRESHHGRRLAVVDVTGGGGGGGGGARVVSHTAKVHYEKHEGRFINLQRLLVKPSKHGKAVATAAAAAAAAGAEGAFLTVEDMNRTIDLEMLHPCAVLTLEILQARSVDSLAISFTPRDSFALWAALEKHIKDKAAVAALEPSKFFGQFGDSKKHQITLAQAKEYEQALKIKLEGLARDPHFEAQVRALLAEFELDDTPSALTPTQLFAFAMKCKESQKTPCLCFQLDSFKCLEMFKDVLGMLEQRQAIEFPDYYRDLELEAEAAAKAAAAEATARESMLRRRRGRGLQADEDEDGADEAVEANSTFVDTSAPHPAYSMSQPKNALSAKELEDLLGEMKRDMEPLAINHPLVRGLRRGIGIYIDDVSQAVYRRIVQRLAQEGKLALVFSDHSLAYGVNMPFRTCAFCGEMGDMLTPLMAQQMSGRTGRRGLDTQGNIVYLGLSRAAISHLILGDIPDIVGRETRYPTVALQTILSDYVDISSGRNACAPPFRAFQAAVQSHAPALDANFFDTSVQLLESLGLIKDMQPALPLTALMACWELRANTAESLALVHVLPEFKRKFVEGKVWDHGHQESVQIEFFARLLHIFDRHPPIVADGVPDTPFHEIAFVVKYKELADWDRWEALLRESDAKIDALPEELLADLAAVGSVLQLPVPIGQPIDATLFTVLQMNRLPIEFPPRVKYDLKCRLFALGARLIKLNNCLLQREINDEGEWQPGEYSAMCEVLRKCFVRLKWVISDSIRNETKLNDMSGVTFSAEVLAAMARAEAEADSAAAALLAGSQADTEEPAVVSGSDEAAAEDGSEDEAAEAGRHPKSYTDGYGTLLEGTYDGPIVNGKAEGKGTWTGTEGRIYRGGFKNHMLHGQGTFTWASGAKYIGAWKADKKHGQGIMMGADGDMYEGAFEADKQHGQGTYTWANRDKYIGAWEADKKHGQGTLTCATGRIFYSGQWIDNHPAGRLPKNYTNNHGTLLEGTYDGPIVNGKAEGEGTWTGPDGRIYRGGFKNHMFHGQGTFTTANGDKYIGAWEADKAHGQGTFSWADGSIRYSGQWIDNHPAGRLPKNYTDGYGISCQGTYDGQIVNGQAEGEGTWTGTDGRIYRGGFKNHMFHGQGTMTWASGDKYIGTFEADKAHGQGTFTWANGSIHHSGQWKDNQPVR